MTCPNAPGCSDPAWCEQCNSCTIARSMARGGTAAANRPRPPRRRPSPPPEPRHELQYAVDEHGKVTAEYVKVEQTLLVELAEW